MMSKTLVVATNNLHKLAEFKAILGAAWHVKGARDVASGVSWDETGTTFLANARIKINALRPLSDGFILADDSGLCVDALYGAPGVQSSSFGGVEGDHPRNVKALLAAMQDVPFERRTAYFYCLLLLSCPDGQEFQFEGRCPGVIAAAPTGGAGFGYDPIFIPKGFDISMAEMTGSQKNILSHRGLATAKLVDFLIASGRR